MQWMDDELAIERIKGTTYLKLEYSPAQDMYISQAPCSVETLQASVKYWVSVVARPI